MYTFHRIGFRDADGKERSAWMALIETAEQLKAWLEYAGRDVAGIWMKIKNSPENKSGHTGTQRADVGKMLLTMEIEKSGKDTISLIDGINHLSNLFTKTQISIFLKEGSIYVNKNGGCRDTRIRNDDRIQEEIFETCVNKDFVFPTLGEDEVEISRWPGGGPHFYISVNGKNVEVAGVSKWNTVQAAEEAKASYIKRNRYKRKKR